MRHASYGPKARPKDGPYTVSVLERLLRDVIEDEHRHRALLQFELQAKLTIERLGQ